MRSLHRTKALAAYGGARLTLKNDQAYPSYMLLKEAARGVLSYILEDSFDKDISEKTKLSRLIELLDSEAIGTEDMENLNKLVEAEQGGLEHILTMDIDELYTIKKTVKRLIAKYLREPV